jgi:hypothetical protein
MRNVLDKSCTENKNSTTFFFFKNRTVYETISKNMVEPEGPHMTSQNGA